MFKKFLGLNALGSFLALSCSSMVSMLASVGQVKVQVHEFTHPNFTENLYFANEMQKALIDYKNFNEKDTFHSHSVEIANLDDGFLFPVTDQDTFQKELLQKEIILENNSSFAKEILLPNFENLNYQIVKKESNFQNSSVINFMINQENYSFKLNAKNEIQNKTQTLMRATKLVPPRTKIKLIYALNQTTYSQVYNYLLPIKNDKWCKKNIGVSGKVYEITPQELFDEIKDDSKLLEYYFGLKEFYQYKDFIGKSESFYLVWVATRIITTQVEQTWSQIDEQIVTKF